MKIGESFIIVDSWGEYLCTFRPDFVLIKKELGQESLTLERLRKSWYTLFGDLSVSEGDDSQSIYLIETISNLDEALISNRVVVQVELT